jgi:hypothetical protein
MIKRVAFIGGVLAMLAGCGRINYEPTDDDDGYTAEPSALVGTWSVSESFESCAHVLSFHADGSVDHSVDCDGRSSHAVGSYVVTGDVVAVEPAASCRPGYHEPWAASWRVDGDTLTLDRIAFHRLELDGLPFPDATEACQ